MVPTVLDVYQARRRLAGRLPKTPLLPSAWLSSIADGSVHLKVESANLTGAFKIRGALQRRAAPQRGHRQRDHHDRHRLGRQSRPRHRAGRGAPGAAVRGVHAGVGARGQDQRASAPRCRAARRLRDYDAAEWHARQFADAEGAVYISAYNHPRRDWRRRDDRARDPRRAAAVRRRRGAARRRRAGQRRRPGPRGRGATGRRRRRRSRGLGAVHDEPRGRADHRDHAAPVAGRRAGRQPRAGIDDLFARQAGRGLRRAR